MKKTLCALLISCLLLGTYSGCFGGGDSSAARMDPPDEEVIFPAAAAEEDTAGQPDAGEEAFPDAAEGQAFAAAMAVWMGGTELLTDPDPMMLYWEMAGWYAARIYRINGYDLIPADRIEEFLRSVGSVNTDPPEDWLEYGAVERHTAAYGERYYAFPRHCREIDAILGVTAEVSLTPLDDRKVRSTVTVHYENGLTESHTYTLTFEKNEDKDSAFPYRLTEIVPPDGPNIVGDLTFTWGELIEANRLSRVLSLYPAIRHFNREFSPESVTWVYPRGDGLTILTLADDYSFGCYNGAFFSLQKRENGRLLASIEDFDPDYTNPEARDGYLTDYLNGITEMRFEKIEGDLIWTECTAAGGLRERVAVDRGTLVLREVHVFYSEELPPSVTCFLYDSTGPALEYLDSWDGPMRTVTVHWEEFPDGVRVTRDEKVRIPADWEYLPRQGRWGDYTVWMNEDYTKLYEYPGDGMDYTLYLTTAKG